MTLQEIICLFKEHASWWAAIAICLSCLVEITPIKINPLSWLAKKLGKAFNGDVMKELGDLKVNMGTEIGALKADVGGVTKEVQSIKQDVSDIREEAKEREATNRRARILDFGDEILHGVEYSKEHWDSVLRDITEYEIYCDSHPHYMNHIAKATIKHIKNMYDKHLIEDSFLK